MGHPSPVDKAQNNCRRLLSKPGGGLKRWDL